MKRPICKLCRREIIEGCGDYKIEIKLEKQDDLKKYRKEANLKFKGRICGFCAGELRTTIKKY